METPDIEVSINGGYPQKWMVYFMETPIYKWMTGGTSISGNLYIYGIYGDYGDQFFVG